MEGELCKMASRSREKMCWMAHQGLQKGPEDLEKVAVLNRKIFLNPKSVLFIKLMMLSIKVRHILFQ